MAQTYSFDVNANVAPAIAQIQTVNTALQDLGKTPITVKVKVDTKAITNQLKDLKATIQVNPKLSGNAQKLFGGNGGSGGFNVFGGKNGVNNVNRISRDFSRVANSTNKNVQDLFRADANYAQGQWTNTARQFAEAIAATNDPQMQSQLLSKWKELSTQRTANFTDFYAKQLDQLNNKWERTVSSAQMKGRSFADTLDIDSTRQKVQDLSDFISNQKNWDSGASQKVKAGLESLKSEMAEYSDPSKVFMDTTSMSKYASKLSKTLDGQMKRDTRKIGQGYVADIEDAISGDSKISLKDWKQNYIPGMEQFIQQANKETNGVTGFFKRMGGSLKGQNAALLGSLFSTGSLVQGAKQMAQATTRVDDAIVELRKVSDASPQRLAQDKEINARTAQKYGTTLSDAIQSTASWSKLGNSLKDAQKLTQISAEFMSVGDRMSASSVQETLTSVQRAWNQTPKQLQRSLDTINQVSVCCPFITKDMK